MEARITLLAHSLVLSRSSLPALFNSFFAVGGLLAIWSIGFWKLKVLFAFNNSILLRCQLLSRRRFLACASCILHDPNLLISNPPPSHLQPRTTTSLGTLSYQVKQITFFDTIPQVYPQGLLDRRGSNPNLPYSELQHHEQHHLP